MALEQQDQGCGGRRLTKEPAGRSLDELRVREDAGRSGCERMRSGAAGQIGIGGERKREKAQIRSRVYTGAWSQGECALIAAEHLSRIFFFFPSALQPVHRWLYALVRRVLETLLVSRIRFERAGLQERSHLPWLPGDPLGTRGIENAESSEEVDRCLKL